MNGKKYMLSGLLAVLLLSPFCGDAAEAAKTVPAKLSAKQVTVGKQVSVKTSVRNAKYSSSNSSVASINADGVVTGKKAGKTEIKVKCSGYRQAVFALEVKGRAHTPTLPVALDEVELQNAKMKRDGSGQHWRYYATIKNKAKRGKIRKVEYYYKIWQEVAVTATAKPTASPAVSSQPTESPQPTSTVQPEPTATVEQESTVSLAASKVTTSKVAKTVVLRASGIKAGKSVRVHCAGDASGDASKMQLQKIKLYTGEALYTYNLKTKKKSLKWSGADKTAPLFSGWVGKKSYYGNETIRVCYADRKKSYSFKDHVKAVDARDGKVSFKVDTSKINWSKDGVYKVYYRAKDKAGNVATAWAKVQVFVPSTAESIADEVLAGLVKKGWSQEKKLRAIYTYVSRHCSYVGSGSHSDWRRAAVNGIRYQSGDCFTYYSVARLLVSRAGIPNLTVTRYPAQKGRQHWWNLVYVRGGWYHFDTTPRQRMGYFCLQTDEQLRIYSTGYTFRFQGNKLPARAKKRISRNPV